MKLSSDDIDSIQRTTGLVPLAVSDTIYPSLESQFGSHTFYLDQWGIYVWEVVDEPSVAASAGATELRAFQIGQWVDEWQNRFQPRTPTATANRVVVSPPGAAEPEAR